MNIYDQLLIFLYLQGEQGGNGKNRKMKKILFTFLIAIVLLLTFCYLIFYSYKVSVLVELKQR
jgi:heme/copper-type cytochrome/quinol oxidase subunit 4